jgi:proteasome assembly chaperone (PAC2) family protein
MQNSIIVIERPSLKNPSLVVGLGGWANAGEVSTGTVAHLLRSLNASKCAEFKSELFFDISQQRPVVTVENGFVKSIEFPDNAFYASQMAEADDHDLVLFLGHEPNLHWSHFIQDFLDYSQKLGVVQIFTIGGLYDNIPHSVDPRVSGLTNLEERVEDFSRLNINPGNYHGPSSIHAQILMGARERQIPAFALWGHVPYYIQSHNAKTCLAILDRLKGLIGFQLDFEDVREASQLLDEQIDRIIQSKPDLKKYIESLEQDYASGEPIPARVERPQPTGDKIIHIDPFLRKDQGPGPPR